MTTTLDRRWSVTSRSAGLLQRPAVAYRGGPRLQQVAAEHRVRALQHGDQPFQAHPGVHVRPVQRLQGAVVQPPVAEQHVVPQLQPPASLPGVPCGGPSPVHTNSSRVGAAQPGRAVRPPVVHPGQLDRDAQLTPGLRQAGVRAHAGLDAAVWPAVHRGVQPADRSMPNPSRDQFVGPSAGSARPGSRRATRSRASRTRSGGCGRRPRPGRWCAGSAARRPAARRPGAAGPPGTASAGASPTW